MLITMEPALEPISGPGIWRPAAILALTVAIVLVALRTLRARGRGNFPLPPGPPPEPLLGHCRTVPQDAAFKRYAEWAREYSMALRLNHALRSSVGCPH